MFPEDMKIYKYFDEEGKRSPATTGAGDTYFDYVEPGPGDRGMRAPPAGPGERPPRRRRNREPPRGSPLFGHSPDFGYLYYGAVWYGDELWNGGRLKDYDGDGRVTDARTAPLHR